MVDSVAGSVDVRYGGRGENGALLVRHALGQDRMAWDVASLGNQLDDLLWGGGGGRDSRWETY